MATTIATAAGQIQDRLNLQTSNSALPLTSSQIQTELLTAFKGAFAQTRPVVKTSGSLSSTLTLAVSNMGHALYVAVGRTMLLPNEWGEDADGVELVQLGWAYSGDTAIVWYVANATLSGATVDSDCIHGSDWLEEVAILGAEIECLVRLSSTGDSGNASFHAQRARMLEQRYNQKIADLRVARNEDLAILERRLDNRRAFGPHTMQDSPLSGFENEAQIINITTAVP